MPQGEAELRIKLSCSGATFPSPDYSWMKFQLLGTQHFPGLGMEPSGWQGPMGCGACGGAGGTQGMDRKEGGKDTVGGWRGGMQGGPGAACKGDKCREDRENRGREGRGMQKGWMQRGPRGYRGNGMHAGGRITHLSTCCRGPGTEALKAAWEEQDKQLSTSATHGSPNVWGEKGSPFLAMMVLSSKARLGGVGRKTQLLASP